MVFSGHDFGSSILVYDFIHEWVHIEGIFRPTTKEAFLVREWDLIGLNGALSGHVWVGR